MNYRTDIKIIIILLITMITCGVKGQELSVEKLDCKISRDFTPLELDRISVLAAQTIADLNPYFKRKWVAETISLELNALVAGKLIRKFGKTDSLNQAQKELLNQADSGTKISVILDYLPNNTLKENDPKVFDFSFLVTPSISAHFPEGEEALIKYLGEKVLTKINSDDFRQYHAALVKFTIDKDGYITDPHIFERTSSEETDSLLLASVCNMPNWIPAEYHDGVKIAQDFVLVIGDLESCTLNFVNIKNLEPE